MFLSKRKRRRRIIHNAIFGLYCTAIIATLETILLFIAVLSN